MVDIVPAITLVTLFILFCVRIVDYWSSPWLHPLFIFSIISSLETVTFTQRLLPSVNLLGLPLVLTYAVYELVLTIIDGSFTSIFNSIVEGIRNNLTILGGILAVATWEIGLNVVKLIGLLSRDFLNINPDGVEASIFVITLLTETPKFLSLPILLY